jgi:hypothetical protein
MLVVGAMLLAIGLVAVAAPQAIRDAPQSYDVLDLVRGWGIYALGLAAVCTAPPPTTHTHPAVLRWVFAVSVLWHVEIAARRGWTAHHKQAVVLNVVGWVATVLV